MKKAYFISDLHLGATYSGDRIEREREAVAWLETIAEDCAELYLLGDVLDYWYEYRTVVPRGYVRFFGALARLADSGVKITWIIGNHDIWIFDYLPSELGVRVVDGVLDTQVLGATRMVMAQATRRQQRRRSAGWRRAWPGSMTSARNIRWRLRTPSRDITSSGICIGEGRERSSTGRR